MRGALLHLVLQTDNMPAAYLALRCVPLTRPCLTWMSRLDTQQHAQLRHAHGT